MQKLIRDDIKGTEDKRKKVSDVIGLKLLKEKLHEEIKELEESGYKDVYEYADVLEVLEELMRRHNVKIGHVKLAQRIKRKERGGFRENYVL